MNDADFVAVHADPWSEELVDLPALNAGASEGIEREISRLRQTARQSAQTLRSTSMVVLGPPGAGKTHLFSRLRRRLGPRAVFVHIRPLVHAEMTPRFVLGETVRQLGYASQGLPQINALVGSLLAHVGGAESSFPSTFLSEYQRMDEAPRAAKLESVLERVLELWKEADESYLQRLLQVPFARGGQQRALLAWLSGRDCDVPQLQRIGATASLSEELCPAALRTLAAVASVGAPIVMVFDQLENLVQAGGSDARLLAYANLAAELVDTMRGLLLVHMALDTEWQRAIEPTLNLSQRSRLIMQQHTLSLPNAKEREDLLRLWIERFPTPDAPFPWPLRESQLARLLRVPGLTPRMLLMELKLAAEGEASFAAAEPALGETAFAEAREGAVDQGDAPAQRGSTAPSDAAGVGVGLEREWEARLRSARAKLDEAFEQRACVDAARLCDGLLACAPFLPNVKLRPAGVKDEPAQLVAEVAGMTRYIALLQHGNPRSLGSVLVKLSVLAAKHAVWAIRERVHELPPTWKDTRAKRHALLATGRGFWLDLDREDAARLLALDELLQCARSGDVTDHAGRPIAETVVCEWAKQTLEVGSWGAVAELFGPHSPAPEHAAEVHTATSTAPPGVIAAQHVFDLEPTARTSSEAADATLPMLLKLRLASLDRLVREVTRVDPRATRTSVVSALEAWPERVRWFGRSIVSVKEET